jgi:nucleotide-binding universal stress UspA family protein
MDRPNQEPVNTTDRSLVVAVDFSPLSDRVVDVAFTIATRDQLTVHVVSVATGPDFPERFSEQGKVDNYLRAEDELGQRIHAYVVHRLEAFTKDSGLPGPPHVAIHPRFGEPAEEIVDLAAAFDAELIVVGIHGKQGVARLLLGSVAEKVTRTAGCAVEVVRPKQHNPDVERPVQIEPPPRRGQGSTLGRRHRYHHVPRNVRLEPSYPLIYHDPFS